MGERADGGVTSRIGNIMAVGIIHTVHALLGTNITSRSASATVSIEDALDAQVLSRRASTFSCSSAVIIMHTVVHFGLFGAHKIIRAVSVNKLGLSPLFNGAVGFDIALHTTTTIEIAVRSTRI